MSEDSEFTDLVLVFTRISGLLKFVTFAFLNSYSLLLFSRLKKVMEKMLIIQVESLLPLTIAKGTEK